MSVYCILHSFIHLQAAKISATLFFTIFLRGASTDLALQVSDLPSSPQREESYPGKRLEAQSGAVNHFSSRHSNEWRAALNLHCIWRTCESPGWQPPTPTIHPPPFTWAERIGVNQLSDLRWETLKRRRRQPPPLPLLLQIVEHYIWNSESFHLSCKMETDKFISLWNMSRVLHEDTENVIKKQEITPCSINGDLQ